jgi:hypothetical protein
MWKKKKNSRTPRPLNIYLKKKKKHMTQTAVEWFAEQVKSAKWIFADVTDRNTIIEQAKQMEMQQIKTAFQDGAHVGYNQDATSEEQYYNSVYKQKA